MSESFQVQKLQVDWEKRQIEMHQRHVLHILQSDD